MMYSEQGFTRFLRSSEILYLFLVALSFYLLFSSRTGEAHTVWEVLHPGFIPTLFVATSLLLVILLTSEKVAYKLFFIIVHSILVHSFFSIVFPVGDLSGQQIVLGRTRLIYDNAVLHGWPPWPVETIESRIYLVFRGENFLGALSVAFARMFSIDLLWIHLFLVPVLWGVFTPIAAYLTTSTLTHNDKVSVLAGLILSAFPYATYFGAISVHNSLGYIFFFYSLSFMLRSLNSNDFQTKALMVVFSFVAFLAHYLTGIMAFSLLLLTLAFRSYRGNNSSSLATRVSIVSSFLISVSLLPLSLIYLRFFRSDTYTSFTLDKLYKLPFQEIVGQFLFGELIYGSDIKTILLIIIGPTLAFFWMIRLLHGLKKGRRRKSRTRISFLFAASLVMLTDYGILKLFMSGLPLNEERLWVFRDFLAAPFVALVIYEIVLGVKSFLSTRSPAFSIAILKAIKIWPKALPKGLVLRVEGLLFTGLLFASGVLIPVFIAGWMTASLSVAYPQVAPLQTTWYELEAVNFIEKTTRKKYVVIGDQWTIFAGEMIVGVNNPRAFYFIEFNKTGYDLFVKMKENPSSAWMLSAMNYTDTTVAYFIVTEPRLGATEFNSTISKALQNGLQFYGPPEGFGNGKLYVFYYEK